MVNGWLVPIAPRGKPDWTLCVPVDSAHSPLLACYQPITPTIGQAGDQVDSQLGIGADRIARFGPWGSEGCGDNGGNPFWWDAGADILFGRGNPFGHLFAIEIVGLGRKT